jgi:hypothetical protein
MATDLTIHLLDKEDELAKCDPLDLQKWFNLGVEKNLAYNANPETAPELTADESRLLITITRILRRTNTGPARAKAPKKASKANVTQDSINKLFDL